MRFLCTRPATVTMMPQRWGLQRGGCTRLRVVRVALVYVNTCADLSAFGFNNLSILQNTICNGHELDRYFPIIFSNSVPGRTSPTSEPRRTCTHTHTYTYIPRNRFLLPSASVRHHPSSEDRVGCCCGARAELTCNFTSGDTSTSHVPCASKWEICWPYPVGLAVSLPRRLRATANF